MTAFADTITTIEQLRELVAAPREAALKKQIDVIDEHCRDFIARSTFVFIATSNAAGDCDVSPKGDVPGFVQVLDEHTLLVPDRPGNQRLDSLRNILENPHVGMIFIIPGVEWTLRVNGRAEIVRDEALLARCAVGGKLPLLGIGVHVEEAFLHCPKCFLRSGLWDQSGWMPPDEQPSFAAILREQTQMTAVPVEAVEKALAASNQKLY
jgi:PPOX class probable FMN-dependent enzyme